MATSVVGCSSCFAKNQRAGDICAISLPSRSRVTWPVIICF
jgi:hypothetical protein